MPVYTSYQNRAPTTVKHNPLHPLPTGLPAAALAADEGRGTTPPPTGPEGLELGERMPAAAGAGDPPDAPAASPSP